MGFIAKNFSFDGVSCSEFGLQIYDIDGEDNEAVPFASTGKVLTDVVSSTGKHYLYGRQYESPLSFTLVFGVMPGKDGMDDYMDRYEMDAIANWLTDCQEYKWLEIEQPDMEMVRYRCIITDLVPIHIGWLPWAFTAKVQCDSPYAYLHPKKYHFDCTGTSTEIKIISQSTIRALYFPKIDITLNGSNTISINNETIGKEFRLDTLPRSDTLVISVDGALRKITSSDSAYANLYQYCNFIWLPLCKGTNNLVVTGKCGLDFTCEYPVNFGG